MNEYLISDDDNHYKLCSEGTYLIKGGELRCHKCLPTGIC